MEKIVEIDPSLMNIQVISDKQRITQILINLLSNSLKFTFKGFIKIKAEKIDIDEEI